MTPDIEQMVEEEHEKAKAEKAQQPKPNSARHAFASEFCMLGGDRYRFSLPEIGVVFEVDRLRREHNELIGELGVRCALPGARTVDGSLSIADFNLSSARARSERAKLLAERARTPGLDWMALVEEFCQRVLQADRIGQPAVELRTLPVPAPEDDLQVEGLHLLRRHPTILFGDGGAAKSYVGLYLVGRLAERGMRVAIFDWELAGEDHRDRLERLFWDGMPQVFYARCERPLVYEADRLLRIVKQHNIDYVVYDSVAFACDGPPESAEVAGRYFRAVRQIGGGSLHIAHVSKGENADQKPFGSAFWHNGARATWYAQLAGGAAENDFLSLGLFNRKANLGRLRPPIGFTVNFSDNRTTFRPADVADSPDLAAQLNVRQRMMALLRKGAMAPEEIAERIDAQVETVKRTVRRYKHLFVIIPGGHYALLERSGS
jgi:hypothetical protein